MIGFVSYLVPQCGKSGMSTSIPLGIGSILENTRIYIKVTELVTSQPSGQIIQRFVDQNAANTLLVTQESIQHNPNICISADKGNKKGNTNLVKFVCWFDKKDKKVKIFLLDVDCTDEATNETSDALNHSICNIKTFGPMYR